MTQPQRKQSELNGFLAKKGAQKVLRSITGNKIPFRMLAESLSNAKLLKAYCDGQEQYWGNGNYNRVLDPVLIECGIEATMPVTKSHTKSKRKPGRPRKVKVDKIITKSVKQEINLGHLVTVLEAAGYSITK